MHPAATPAGCASHFSMSVTQEFEQFLRQCDEPALIGLLRAMQVRLGTAQEAPDDLERAAAVMHQLNNLRAMRALARDVFPPVNPGEIENRSSAI